MGIVSRSALSTGDIPTAAEWNTQFDTIYTEFNGSIEAANLASDSVTGPKIATGAVSADKLGLISTVVSFTYDFAIGATAESIRKMMFPYNGTLTKVIAKSAKDPDPQNLVINLTNGDLTVFGASSMSMTGTDAVTLDGGSLANTTIAANSLLELDIIGFGTSTGGGEPLTVNAYIDVAGTEL
jgi:hypothetical protein